MNAPALTARPDRPPALRKGPNPGRTYRFFPGAVRYPFGHGLTLGAEFSYEALAAAPAAAVKAAAITAAVTGPAAVR
eukprot:SAG22_NODE_1148_length_5359_cov_2.946958_4_plen_77_part_00